jgi:hypothetical protein
LLAIINEGVDVNHDYVPYGDNAIVLFTGRPDIMAKRITLPILSDFYQLNI